LRCMLAISLGTPENPVPISRIVEQERLPRAYVEQLVFRLRKAGLLTSIRGTKGGYLLARDAGEIYVSEVLDALEKGWLRIFCDRNGTASGANCLHRPGCPLSELWVEVRDYVLEKFSRTSLRNLLERGYVPGGRREPCHPLENVEEKKAIS